MRRQLLALALCSIIGVVASNANVAVAAQDATPSTASKSIAEPAPIVLDEAIVARARQILDSIADGTFDRSQLAPQLNAFLPADTFSRARPFVRALGSPKGMYPFEQRITAGETSTYFRVTYPQETLTWIVSVDKTNRIVGLSLRRSPSNRIVSLVYRDIEY